MAPFDALGVVALNALRASVDPMDTPRPPAGRSRAIVTAFQVYVVLGGLVSLAGWVFDVERFADWDADGIAIQPNATLAAIAAGLAVACLAWGRNRAAALLASFVALLGAATIFQYVADVELGIDGLLLFDRTWGRVGVLVPGRMGPPGATSWTVLGIAIVLASSAAGNRARARSWAAGLALTTAGIASLSLIGYLYGASALYSIPTLTVIAQQTATFLLCASLGVVLAIPERGPMRLFGDPGPTGILARRLLPALIAMPVLLGFLRLAGFRAHLYDAEFGTALRTVAEIVLLLLFLWWCAGTLRRQEKRRQEADEALLDRERALSEAQRLAQVGSWHWEAETDVVVASYELYRIYGVPPEREFPRFREQKGTLYSPEVWSALDAAARRAMATGQGFQVDVEALRGDERIWVAVRCEIASDATGRVSGARGTVQDISARRRAEEELRRQERLLRSVTEHAQVGLVIVDRSHRYLYANPSFAAVIGKHEDQIVGRLVSEVMGDAHAAQARTRLEHAFEGSRVQYEVSVQPANAIAPRWFSATYEPQTDEAGAVTSVVIALVEVTARREIEAAHERVYERERNAREEAERAVRIKDEFLATLSHELRTPLNAMLGWAQILRRDASNAELARAAAEVIERNGRAQAQLITDLLDMSRIMSGKMRLEVQPMDLELAVEAAIESMAPAAQGKGVRIERETERVRIAGDPERLQQVVWNLLSNAVKFTPRDGVVRVQLARTGEHVEIRVSDTGEGIAPEFLPHMFERFRQADASPSRSHGGLGIGLALVKQLVELHGGRVHATSAGKGRGSTFVVELPCEHAAPEHAARVAPTPTARTSGSAAPISLRGARVLVVDDEPDALIVAARMLEGRGAQVATANSAEVAWMLLAERAFDVVISDLGMPGTDGHAFLRAVRERGVATPALALSAFVRDEDRSKSEASGFQAHLAKPVDADELMRAVAALASPPPS